MLLKHTGALFSMMSLLGCGSSGGGGVQEVFTVTAVDDNPEGSLSGKLFTASDHQGTVLIQMSQASYPPGAPPGGYDRVVIVEYPANITGPDIIFDIENAFVDDSGFTVVAANGIVTFTNKVAGARTDAADIDTGFTITTTQQGSP